MCGRFVLTTPGEMLAKYFGLSRAPQLQPRYNIAPTQPVAAVRSDSDGELHCAMLRWGLIPDWAADPSVGNRMINSRVETVAEKPAFRDAFRRRRCLVMADGFYEWKRCNGGKQPYYVGFDARRPFGLAGLWESWRPRHSTAELGTSSIETCALITVPANDRVAPIHDRMPAILEPADHAAWLDPARQESTKLLPLLRPHSEVGMVAFAVSRLVNDPRNDDPACLQPLSTMKAPPSSDRLF